MGKLFLKIILVCVSCFWAAGVFAQVTDGVAAIVNEKIITFSEVKRLVEPTEQQLRATTTGVELMEKVKEARLSALKSLIERQLIIQQFDKAGYFMQDSIIEARVNEIIASQYGGDRNALIRTLHANGISMASFKEELRGQMIVQAMRHKNISSIVIVSPFKIEQYYQENISQFVDPKQVKLRLIFVRPALAKEKRTNAEGKEEEFDPQYQLAQDLHRKLNIGADFAELARNYSEGAQRSNGGDWGWVTESTLRPELSSVAFSLKPGQYSEVISTPDGYYILMVEDFKRQKVMPLGEVREQIEKALLQQERERLQKEWLDGLRARAFIKMF